MAIKTTPLTELHRAAGARMTDFAGWDMPLQYAGILDEHRTVRSACGVFDISHMGRLAISRDGSTNFLERMVSRSVSTMNPGMVRYALVCNPDGGIEDDVLVSRGSPTPTLPGASEITEECYHIVVNAANREKIITTWNKQDDAAKITDLTEQQAMVAVQGPHSREILTACGLQIDEIRYYRFQDRSWNGHPIRISRTGYTGENGYELFIDSAQAAELWQALTKAGAIPCGLGARDSLRLEAGMPLYGQELDSEHSPIEAGLNFAVAADKSFIGSDIIHQHLTTGPSQTLVGLVCTEGRPPRPGYPILNNNGENIGTITSGGPSPTLNIGIAMGYVPTTYSTPGTTLTIDIRGRSQTTATVTKLPFYKRPK